MTHDFWTGREFGHGPVEPGVLILGYSHYLGGGTDSTTMTVDILNSVVDGKKTKDYGVDERTPFFAKIAACFKQPPSLFWNSVMFMNLIPEAIGGANEKYDWASHEQAVAGCRRLFQVIRDHEIKKLYVFSAKAWESLPETICRRDLPLSQSNPHSFNVFSDAPDTVAFHLRHPQFASPRQLDDLSEAVRLASDPARDFLAEVRKVVAR